MKSFFLKNLLNRLVAELKIRDPARAAQLLIEILRRLANYCVATSGKQPKLEIPSHEMPLI